MEDNKDKKEESTSILPAGFNGIGNSREFDVSGLGNALNGKREVSDAPIDDMFSPENFLSEAEKDIISNDFGGDITPTKRREVSNPRRPTHPPDEEIIDDTRDTVGMSTLQRKILGL